MITWPSLLGELSAEEFLSDYWQQRPLLIRNALPIADNPPLEPDQLAGLALEEWIESRLINSKNWEVEHGPLEPDRFSSLPERDWTLLVQAVDLWIPEVAALLESVDFLPRWQIDDIMVSYAAPGGNVGAHLDNYDVFLLQGLGRRQWQIENSPRQHRAASQSSALRLVDDFTPDSDWVLEPGDLLYLPPQFAHHGVALDPCITYSIGFRAPSSVEIINDLALELLAGDREPDFLRTLVSPTEPEIAEQQVDAISDQLKRLLEDKQLLGDWYARYMSRPKYPDLVDMTGEQRRVEWRGARYCNGELEESI